MGQFGSTVQQFPQVVLNGGSTTSFTIHNPDAEKTIDVDVQLYSPSGGALTDGQVELGPGETETVSFGEASAPLTRGWAELKSDDEFIATEFFQLFLAAVLKPRVGVLPSPPAEEIKFLGFVNAQFKSGLAVHNPSPTEATEITLRLKDNAGQEPVAEKKLTLAPLQSEAAFLNEALLFGPALSSFEGVVEITVNSPPVAVLSLIQEANGDVATVAVETASYVTTGPSNTSIGRGALGSNTTGLGNTATGASALFSNTTGDFNTALGEVSLFSNTTGSFNTANGVGALFSNTTGNNNTALGIGALGSNTTGERNTASGFSALLSNTTGNFNTAMGVDALRDNTTGGQNTAVGDTALGSNTTGLRNTASGVGTLFSNTEGVCNTALGVSALFENTTGNRNTALGEVALFANTTGSFNTASGVSALFANTTGDNNTATGFDALKSNTEGNRNTATGRSALISNTTGSNNTGLGMTALARNTTGERNTAVGDSALGNKTAGSNNTGLGMVALRDNITGERNTAVGDSALWRSLGSDNIGIGFFAGGALENGNDNIYIGNSGANESNTIRIGSRSHILAEIAGVQVVPVSSRRFKEDIHDMAEASSHLMSLRPVTFRYKKEYDKGDSRLQYGLIAEEVAEVYPELVVNDGTGHPRTVEYQKLNVMLLNELQKQHRKIEAQERRNADLAARLARLEQE